MLICAFVVRIWHKTHFLMARLIFIRNWNKRVSTCPHLADFSGGNWILNVTCPWGKQNLLVKYLHRLNQNMYFWIFTFFIMAQYMVKTSLFQHFSSYYIQVYIVLITRQVDKQKGKLKLCQACPLGKCFPKSYVNPCLYYILNKEI